MAHPDDLAGRGGRAAVATTSEIRSRSRAARAVKKARGERTGGVPMGSRVGDDGMLAADEVERGAVVRARELRGEGKSLREIARALIAEGHAPPGKRWHVQTLARVVARGL